MINYFFNLELVTPSANNSFLSKLGLIKKQTAFKPDEISIYNPSLEIIEVTKYKLRSAV